MRSLIVLLTLLGLLVFGWLVWRNFSWRPPPQAAPVITKEPVAFTKYEFDPAAPPADMPPLAPGEIAECDSDFQSRANLVWKPGQTDSTHATVTVSQVRMALQLRINIWVPTGATEQLIEHEEGHRQISEYYYQTADKIAAQIAANYIGRQVDVTGGDLHADSDKVVQQLAKEITAEYGRQLDPAPAQSLYDSITDHGRNGVAARDAVAHALKNVVIEGNGPKSP